MANILVDIHGQHAHQSLSRPKTQREILDQAGTYDSLLSDVADNYHQWKLVNEQLQNFETSGDGFETRLSFLKYQIDELTQLDIGESEYELLVEEFKRQSHSQDLIATCQQVLTELSESDSAIFSHLTKTSARNS